MRLDVSWLGVTTVGDGAGHAVPAAALMALKKKKLYETQLEQVENNILRVNEQQVGSQRSSQAEECRRWRRMGSARRCWPHSWGGVLASARHEP